MKMELYFTPQKLLIHVIIICDLVLAQHSSDSLSGNECKHCKILANSVNYWLEKTSRGKFEGGDAAWEEAKLKSYSRSEIRLVEVQEGLCSEVKIQKDRCYHLAEETDQALEKWWFNVDPADSDIFTWLCIETRKECCPEKHYGEHCSPCPTDGNNVMCSGHGKCDGDGTRRGNGTCICKKGYAGQDCEKCAENFYSAGSGRCQPCHKSCNECSGPGTSACVSCKPGWMWESGECRDIDECTEPSSCKSTQFCTNNEGSYDCNPCDTSCKTCVGPGPSNCSSCDTQSILWSNMCVDNNLKHKILMGAVQRTLLYIGLLVITFFVYRESSLLASFVVLTISVYIYYSEKSYSINILHVVSNFQSWD